MKELVLAHLNRMDSWMVTTMRLGNPEDVPESVWQEGKKLAEIFYKEVSPTAIRSERDQETYMIMKQANDHARTIYGACAHQLYHTKPLN
jgi:hypothetical protein